MKSFFISVKLEDSRIECSELMPVGNSRYQIHISKKQYFEVKSQESKVLSCDTVVQSLKH